MALWDDYDPTAYGAKCSECPLNGQTVVPPKFGVHPRLVIVSEAPGRDEELRRTPLVGRAGAALEAILEDHGVPLHQVHKTNAILCRPKSFDLKAMKQAIVCCRPRLEAELNEVAEQTAISQLFVSLLGRWALEAVAGKAKITDWLGSPEVGAKFNAKGQRTLSKNAIIDFSFVRWIATFHPGMGLRSPELMPVIETHIVWAWQMACGALPEWTWPEIAYDDADHRKDALRKLLVSKDIIACDVETAGLLMTDALLDIGFSDSKVAVSVPWDRLIPGQDDEEINLVKQLLTKSSCRFVYHNGQFDVNVLAANGFALEELLKRWVFDTLIAHHTCAPRLSHKLDFVACVEFALPRWKQHFRASSEAGSNRYVAADPVERAIYNARDCYVTHRLQIELAERITNDVHNGNAIFERYMELTKIAARMRYDGFAIVTERFGHHRKELTVRKRTAEAAINRLLRPLGITEFNPSKTRHVRAVFQNTLGVKSNRVSKKTGLPSYDGKALLEIAAGTFTSKVAPELARLILIWRRWAKLLDTYINGMPVYKGKIHATWNVFGTRTGRWSSQDPSLQVIPKPKIDRQGKIIAPGLRDTLGVRKPSNWLLEIDYSQLEARILALLAPDRTLLQWYKEGRDVHRLTAASLFKKAEADVNDKERDLAKRARYGIAYMGTAKTIWRSLVVDYPSLLLSDVERLLIAFFKLHPDILGWQQRIVREARTKGFVEAPLSGRRFRFHGGVVEPTKCVVAIQMTAADLMDGSVIETSKTLQASRGERILAQVHDSLVIETGPDWAPVAKKVKAIMERTISLGGVETSFPVDVKVGKDWGNARKVKFVNGEAILA